MDPWLVYRLHHDDKLSFIDIVRRLFSVGPDATPANDEEVKRLYDQVLRAYAFAEQALDRIGKEYA